MSTGKSGGKPESKKRLFPQIFFQPLFLHFFFRRFWFPQPHFVAELWKASEKKSGNRGGPPNRCISENYSPGDPTDTSQQILQSNRLGKFTPEYISFTHFFIRFQNVPQNLKIPIQKSFLVLVGGLGSKKLFFFYCKIQNIISYVGLSGHPVNTFPEHTCLVGPPMSWSQAEWR